MTAVASRPHVVEIESQVRPLSNRNLMIGMQVAVAATECSTQFIQHPLRRWNSESDLAEYFHDLRLPTAIHTPPPIALKTEDPQSAVVGVVATLLTRASAFVMFMLSRAAVLFARSAVSEYGTARGWAGVQDPPHVAGMLVGYHAHLGIHTDQACRDPAELYVGLRVTYL